MYLYLTIGGIVVLVIIASLYGYKKWGASQERQKQAERIAKDRSKDAEIASEPFIARPLDRMRRKN